MKRHNSFFWVHILFCVALIFPAAEQAISQTLSEDACIGCHSRGDVLPGIFKQHLKSRHFAKNVTCIDCHGAEKDDSDAFEHEGHLISIIVSPDDCNKCHERAVTEFNKSSHARARQLVTTGVGAYFLKHLAGSQSLPDFGKHAAGTNGCLRCHGSKIEIDENGRPTPASWPNSGIARVNPDGSIGNCAACHERHDFSVAQARQPESCSICHNAGGGDPQIEAYNMSRHGTRYRAKIDQMNLHARQWIVGQDYVAAPTCATCHMSAARDLPATHNINERLDWNSLLQETNTLASKEKCGIPAEGQAAPYKQPQPDIRHRDNMKKVCRACHADLFVENFLTQYEDELRLSLEKWLKPGKKLYQLATKVLQAAEKEEYKFMTHPIDFAWFGMCNSDAKNVHTGAAMMSAGLVEMGNGGFASAWYSSFIPAIEGIIEEHKNSHGAVKEAVEDLSRYFVEIQNDPVYSGPWH